MWRIAIVLPVLTLALVFPPTITGQHAAAKEITFTTDVAPILYANCVYCHRPGEIGPMSLVTYKDARPWAKSIKQEVLQRRMPPWQADPHFGDFQNDRRLDDRDIQTIVSWVDGGAREGKPADLPVPPQFAEGWQIGAPDLVVTAEPYTVPARGTIPWLTLSSDYVFPEDVWVRAVEIRPGNRRVVHHATAGFVNPNAAPGEGGSGNLHLYSPGLDAMIWRDGYGKRIPKGSRIQFSLHYNAIGQEVVDQTKVGLVFAKAPVHTEVRTTTLQNDALLIPPMVHSHEVVSVFQLPAGARIHALRPHMHVRGKTASASLVFPDGRRNTVLHVPRWDDAWQNYYMLSKPATVPKGTLLEYVATFDNSPANPLNPDPKSPVSWGQQVWEEMQSFWMTWSEINDRNKNDYAPIQVPANKAFTTGVLTTR